MVHRLKAVQQSPLGFDLGQAAQREPANPQLGREDAEQRLDQGANGWSGIEALT